ncbi:MAG: AraC family transcriptional regulator [Firmicutes bacterium]|nr:AraC family transcriptional regulator [Bacillota bacterium]
MWEHFEVTLDYLVRRATYCGWGIAPRRISNYELVFVLKGQGNIVLENKQMTIQPGDLVCFRPGVLHSLSVSQEPCMEFYGVHFTLPAEMEQLPLPDLAQIKPAAQLEALFKDLLGVYQKKAYLYQWRQNLLLQQILCEIFTALYQESIPAEQARIKKVLEYIHEDPSHPFTLEDLTARAGVKKTLFLQSFRNVTGTSPKQYIIGLRLESARSLLLETQMPVSQIAEKCGFTDAFYFSRRFKAKFSESPQQYRKAHL